MTPRRVLHCHSRFSPGGKELRTATLINAFGASAEHVIWTAGPDQRGAAQAIAPDIAVRFAEDAPPLNGRPGLARYRAIADYMQGFDRVLTYNWGAMDVVAARRLFPNGCPALIHHEDGFNADEAKRLFLRRTLFRRWALPAAEALIVPSQTLCRIAQRHWAQGAGRVRLISNGVDLAQFSPRAPGARKGPVIIGAVGALRPVKNFARLIRAFASLACDARLVILGEGPDRAALLALAQSLGVAERVELAGHVAPVADALRDFDVFALSSDSEQAPLCLLEAMACGLPVVATDVGDVRAMLSQENQPFVASPGDETGYAQHLSLLVQTADQRLNLGSANRREAEARHDVQQMIRSYATAYQFPDLTASLAR